MTNECDLNQVCRMVSLVSSITVAAQRLTFPLTCLYVICMPLGLSAGAVSLAHGLGWMRCFHSARVTASAIGCASTRVAICIMTGTSAEPATPTGLSKR